MRNNLFSIVELGRGYVRSYLSSIIKINIKNFTGNFLRETFNENKMSMFLTIKKRVSLRVFY